MKNRLYDFMSTSMFRMICLIIIVILPINILTVILGNKVVNGAENQVSEETGNALALYMNQVDDAMKRMILKMGNFARDDIDFNRVNVKEIDDQTEWYTQLQNIVNLNNNFQKILNDNTWITGIYAYFPQKDMMPVSSKYIQHDVEVLSYIRKKSADADQNFDRCWEWYQAENNQYLVLMDQYKNASFGAWIDIHQLADRLKISIEKPEDDSMMFIADSSGQGLYPTWARTLKISFESKYQKIDGVKWSMQYAGSEMSDIVLVNLVSKNEISTSLPRLILILQFSSIASLVILPIIIVAMRRWMIRPLSRLSAAMKEIETGNMDFRIQEEKTGSEFENINRNFNHMMDEVTQLRIHIYEEKLLARDIKLRFLTQQIQPHFILNTMNIIYSYEPDEYDLIQKMVLCLSKYFRYVVNANVDFVLLYQEMEHIKNYFDIQQVRYPKTFFAMAEYDDDLRNCLVPPLLVQNFAENAIKHSLKIGNKIDIFVIAQKINEDKLRIRLLDTGLGISEEVLAKIEVFRKTGIQQEGLGVGIQNAIERLYVIYGEEAELMITQVEPHGTQVEILLPLRFQEGENDDEDDTG